MIEATDGYAPLNGLELYWESRGSGGTPLIVVHGGYGLITMASDLIDSLAERRQVVAIELQGHGHTADIDRPFTFEFFGDDIAELISHLELGRADLLGYSLGAHAVLRAAIQHPNQVRKLAVISTPFQRHGWFPEVLAAFDQMNSSNFAFMKDTPLYQEYVKVAPDPDAFPRLIDKTGELLRRPFDWSDEIRTYAGETLLAYADADSIPVSHIAAFYALLGGGLQDANWDGSARSTAQLAIVPNSTHYDVFGSSQLARILDNFFTPTS